MEEAADRDSLAARVVERDGPPGLRHLYENPFFHKPLQGFGGDPQAPRHSFGEHRFGAAPHHRPDDVGRLSPGYVASTGVAPIPCPGAAGKRLRVLERAPAFDPEAAPGEGRNPRRWRA